jgi:hypothetical protein
LTNHGSRSGGRLLQLGSKSLEHPTSVKRASRHDTHHCQPSNQQNNSLLCSIWPSLVPY